MKESKVEGNSNAEGMFDSSEDFFDKMDNSVNGMIQDNPSETTEVTPPASGPEQVTHTQAEGTNTNNDVDWEKGTRIRLEKLKRWLESLRT